MSIFSENKLLFGAVGIALSSVAVGYVVGRRHKKMVSYSWKTLSGSKDVVKQYLLDHGIREPESLRKLREVRFSKFCSRNKTYIEEKGMGMIDRFRLTSAAGTNLCIFYCKSHSTDSTNPFH